MGDKTRRELINNTLALGVAITGTQLLGGSHVAAETTVHDAIVNDPTQGAPAGVGDVQAAWQTFIDALGQSDQPFSNAEGLEFDDAEMAYGYRYLAHLMRFVTDVYLYGDPDTPVFLPVQEAPVEKTLGGHPDVHYYFAPVRGDRRYRITGQRGDEAYLSFTLHHGVRGSGMEQFFDSHLNHHDIKTDEQGRFEVMVSPTREGQNWLQSSPDATEVYARAYMFDRADDKPASFQIEALDTPEPRRPGTADIAERLQWATRALREMSHAFVQPLGKPNQIGELWKIEPQGPSKFWQAVDNVYCRGVFSLLPSEALVLEGTVGPCDYWGIQLWSPCGLGSGDFRLGPVAINSAQAQLGPHGEFRVAIALEDPGVSGLDWISTAGEHRGTFFIRWMVPREAVSVATCQLVSLDELRA